MIEQGLRPLQALINAFLIAMLTPVVTPSQTGGRWGSLSRTGSRDRGCLLREIDKLTALFHFLLSIVQTQPSCADTQSARMIKIRGFRTPDQQLAERVDSISLRKRRHTL